MIEFLTQHGVFDVALPTAQRFLYINAVIDGTGAIQNMIAFPTENNTTEHPLTTYSTFFALDVTPGQPVGTVNCELYVNKDGYASPPTGADPIPVVAVEDEYQGGAIDFNDPADLPPAEDYIAPPIQPGEVKEVKTRPDYCMVDLDEPADNVACAPGAVASSFDWLKRTYCLTLDKTKQQMLEEIKLLMGVAENDLPNGWDSIYLAKEVFVRKEKLPLTVEHQGEAGTFTDGAGVVIADIYEQMCRGQDVELHFRWMDAMGKTTSHSVGLVDMTRIVRPGETTYEMTIHDDSSQRSPMGNNRRRKGRVVDEAGALKLKNAGWEVEIRAWTAESPTLAAIRRAVAEKSDTLVGELTGAIGAGAADEATACAMLALATNLKWLSDRLQDNVNFDFPDGSAVRQKADEIVERAEAIIPLALAVKGLVDQPAQLQVMEELLPEVQGLQTLALEFQALFPEDLDFDDVPDVDDNCDQPNPDQFDCDGNGIGDVCELDANDCNNNGQVDVCDIDQGVSMDTNGNGIPDECEP